MNAKHLLVHLARRHKKDLQDVSPLLSAQEMNKHIRESFGHEQLTLALKTRLVEKRKREALREELRDIEIELIKARSTQRDRVERLQNIIAELRQKL